MWHWLLRKTVCQHKGHRVRKRLRLANDMVLIFRRCGRCQQYIESDLVTIPFAEFFDLGGNRDFFDDYENPFYRNKRLILPWE